MTDYQITAEEEVLRLGLKKTAEDLVNGKRGDLNALSEAVSGLILLTIARLERPFVPVAECRSIHAELRETLANRQPAGMTLTSASGSRVTNVPKHYFPLLVCSLLLGVAVWRGTFPAMVSAWAKNRADAEQIASVTARIDRIERAGAKAGIVPKKVQP